jgi:hypothetical protein
MLCGISVVFSLLGDVFALVSCQRGSENRQARPSMTIGAAILLCRKAATNVIVFHAAP